LPILDFTSHILVLGYRLFQMLYIDDIHSLIILHIA
jgi:hypothetical protein